MFKSVIDPNNNNNNNDMYMKKAQFHKYFFTFKYLVSIVFLCDTGVK